MDQTFGKSSLRTGTEAENQQEYIIGQIAGLGIDKYAEHSSTKIESTTYLKRPYCLNCRADNINPDR